MAKRIQKLMIGRRLKVLRKSLGLTQAQLAEQLDVSASYITLIEADQRPASANLLLRLAQVYDMNIGELAPEMDAQLASDFEAALKDPALELAALPRSEIEAALQASPQIAAAVVRLHGKLTEARMRDQAPENPFTDRAKVEAIGEVSRPDERVRDWLYATDNYMDAVDRAAEQLAFDMALHREEPHLALTDRMSRHGIRVRILPAEVMGGALRRYDPHRKELMLSELLAQASRRFQIGVLIARLEYEALIEAQIDAAGFKDADTRSLARVSLANYFSRAKSLWCGNELVLRSITFG